MITKNTYYQESSAYQNGNTEKKSHKLFDIRFAALREINNGIISAKSVEDIVTEILNYLSKLFVNHSKSSIILFDENDNVAIIFSRKFEDYNTNSIEKIEIPLKTNFDLELEREIHLIDNSSIKTTNPFYKEIYFDHGIQSCISIPLLIDEYLIGTILISSIKPDYFDWEHKEVLFLVSNQAAIAIYHILFKTKAQTDIKKLQNLLSEKNEILKAIHHRFKNNLQIISSLLYLNSKKVKDENIIDLFKDSQNKVKSIALIYETLFQSKKSQSVKFKEYVRSLLVELFKAYGLNQEIVKTIINIEDVQINIDSAVSCGLIINELVSNSLKYAFPELGKTDKENVVSIDVTRSNESELLLIVKDNGIGINTEMIERKERTLGIQLVETLVEQLEGTIEMKVDSGTTYKIRFEESNAQRK